MLAGVANWKSGGNLRFTLSLLLALVVAAPAFARQKPVQNCKVSFAFVYVDRLDNTYRGIQGKQLKQVQDKLSKYGDVCYTGDEAAADYVFFVHTKPAVYHGVQTTSHTSTSTDTAPVTGTITDQNGDTSTITGTADTTTTTTSTSSVPYDVDYSVYILNIMVPHLEDGSTARTFVVLHTFDQRGLYNTIYGIGYGKGKNPIVSVIDAAAQWLHENNLGN